MTVADERPASKWPIAVFGAVVLVTVVVLVVFRDEVFGFFGDPHRVRIWAARFGPGAPIAIIGITATQVIVAPIPGQFAGLAAGYLFGTWVGTAYTMVGLVLGTAAAMLIARRLGRPWVKRFVPEARLERWDRVTKRWGPPVFFAAFIIPGIPDDLLCFVIGLSRLPLGPMLLLVTIGRFPGMVGAAYLGANAGDLPVWVWPVAIAGGIAMSAVLFFFGDRLESLSLALGRRLGRKGPASDR